jgi:hypothetical protein
MDENGYWCSTASVQGPGNYTQVIEFPAHDMVITKNGVVYPGNSYSASATPARAVGDGMSLVKANDANGIALKSLKSGTNVSINEDVDGTITSTGSPIYYYIKGNEI